MLVAPKKKSDILKLETLIQKHKLSQVQVKAVIDSIQTIPNKINQHKHKWGERHVRVGLLGDTHIGSKYTDYGALNDIYKRFESEGVKAIYHTGDMTEGYGRRKGHSYECDLHGVDAQVAGVVSRYPTIAKVKTYFIGGDHDSWHYESAGVDIGLIIQKERSDLKYLGAFQANIQLGKNTTLKLVHPAKGTAYAISYQIQKMIEAFSGGEKPNVLAVGHYHKAEYLFYRNIHAFQTGCIQSQSPWMARMNLSAHKGAWVLDIWMDKIGGVDKIGQTFFPYY